MPDYDEETKAKISGKWKVYWCLNIGYIVVCSVLSALELVLV